MTEALSSNLDQWNDRKLGKIAGAQNSAVKGTHCAGSETDLTNWKASCTVLNTNFGKKPFIFPQIFSLF